MDGADEDVGSVVEDLLCPVAVVRVDVEDGDRTSEPVRERSRCNRRVVEVTGASVARSACVMSGWSAACIGTGRACKDEIHRCEGRVDGAARRVPGSRTDQGHRVVCEEAGLGPDGGGKNSRPAGRQLRMGEHVWHDAILARLPVERRRGPFVPGRLEKHQ